MGVWFVIDIRDFFKLLSFFVEQFFRQSSPIGDPKMKSSSVFIFILGHIFRNCVKFELYYVLVVGPKKKQSSNFLVFKFRP